MNKIFSTIIICIISLQNVFADPALEKSIADALSSYAKDNKVHASYAVALKGNVFTRNSVGFSDIETGEALKIDTIFPVASITKNFTAVSILLLQERGLLNVSDKVSKHLSDKHYVWAEGEVPAWADQVTIHQLLTHSHGLPDYLNKTQIDISKGLKNGLKTIVGHLSKQELQFMPGSKTQYGNSGYLLLGLIIESVSDQDLSEFYKQEFFDKLDMKNTSLASIEDANKYFNGDMMGKFPRQYFAVPSFDEAKAKNASLIYAMKFTKLAGVVPYSDGGIISNVSDLMKWKIALHDGKILSEASYKQMVTPYIRVESDTGNATSHYGYGMYISQYPEGITYYHHEGRSVGMRGDAGYIPAADMHITILSNVVLSDQGNNYDGIKPYVDIVDLRKNIFNIISNSLTKNMASSQI